MAKDKKKTKVKIPKQIAGVKIPKELRKKAKVAVALAENPMARELLAAGLTAAAAAIVKLDDKPEADEPAQAKPQPRKRETFAAVAKDIAMGVAAAYAEGSRKKPEKPNGGALKKIEDAAH